MSHNSNSNFNFFWIRRISILQIRSTRGTSEPRWHVIAPKHPLSSVERSSLIRDDSCWNEENFQFIFRMLDMKCFLWREYVIGCSCEITSCRASTKWGNINRDLHIMFLYTRPQKVASFLLESTTGSDIPSGDDHYRIQWLHQRYNSCIK